MSEEPHSSLLDLALCSFLFYICWRDPEFGVDEAKQRIEQSMLATLLSGDEELRSEFLAWQSGVRAEEKRWAELLNEEAIPSPS
jgi:hypothetical protein